MGFARAYAALFFRNEMEIQSAQRLSSTPARKIIIWLWLCSTSADCILPPVDPTRLAAKSLCFAIAPEEAWGAAKGWRWLT